MTPLERRIARAAEAYPDRRSAILEALRLAQEEHDGWLPPEALV
jgi:NADH:ubiquinone oxidoreductase subunit E